MILSSWASLPAKNEKRYRVAGCPCLLKGLEWMNE